MSGHVLERLSPFLDGEVEEAERREILAHLESCPECAAYLADLAAIDSVARRIGVEAPPGYFDALPGRIRQRVRGRSPRRVPVWGLAAAAALLLAVLLPKLSYQPVVPPPPPAAAPAARAPLAPPPSRLAEPRAGAPEPAQDLSSKLQAPSVPEESLRPTAKAIPSTGTRSTAGGSLKSSAPVETGRLDAPQPGGAGQPRDEAKTESARTPMQSLGYAAPPAPPPQPALVEERAEVEAEQQKPAAPEGNAAVAGGAASRERRKEAFAEDKGKADVKQKDALALTLHSVAEARSLRERARERARRHPEGVEGDEARFELFEAGARAYALSRDPRDLDVLKQDAQAYLKRGDVRHADEVRERLRSLEDRP